MRRPLRRRHIYCSAIPSVDDGSGAEPRANDPDIAMLRQDERFKAVGNEIADWVVYRFFQSEPRITNTIKAKASEAAIRQFAGRLPDGMIRALVSATIQQELGLREQTARWHRAEAARKAEDGVRRSTVLLSAPQTGPV